VSGGDDSTTAPVIFGAEVDDQFAISKGACTGATALPAPSLRTRLRTRNRCLRPAKRVIFQMGDFSVVIEGSDALRQGHQERISIKFVSCGELTVQLSQPSSASPSRKFRSRLGGRLSSFGREDVVEPLLESYTSGGRRRRTAGLGIFCLKCFAQAIEAAGRVGRLVDYDGVGFFDLACRSSTSLWGEARPSARPSMAFRRVRGRRVQLSGRLQNRLRRFCGVDNSPRRQSVQLPRARR